MAITLYDFLSFPFNGGRGVRQNQIDAAGIQSYFCSGISWDDESDPAELRLSQYFGANGGATIDGTIANILFRIPAMTPRGVTELTARVVTGSGTDSGLIVRDLRDRRVRARNLIPNGLYFALYATGSPGSLRFIEPLPVRPQDFAIWLGWFASPFDALAIATGTTFDVPDVTIPSHPMNPPPSPAFLVLGTPATAPPVERFVRTNPGGTELVVAVATFLNTLGLSVGGVPFTWYAIGPPAGLNAVETPGAPVGRTYQVIYGD